VAPQALERAVAHMRGGGLLVLPTDTVYGIGAPAADAAAALGITADRLQKLNLVDKVIEEPLGGAHRNHGELMQRLREVLAEQLRIAQDMPLSDLLDRRFDRIMAYGQFVEK